MCHTKNDVTLVVVCCLVLLCLGGAVSSKSGFPGADKNREVNGLVLGPATDTAEFHASNCMQRSKARLKPPQFWVAEKL